jgi:mannose-6-phosphate isomerase-like protein (cupin superfamily)
MADYTVANLKEIDDSAVKFGLAPDVEARFGRKPLDSERSGVSYQRLASGVRQPFGHRHTSQEETYVVVAGSGRVKLEDEVLELRTWDTIRVAPGTMRCFEAGDDGLEYLAFGAGEPETPETVQGWWSD